MTPRTAALLACGLVAGLDARAGDALAELAAAKPGTLRVYLIRHGQALSNLQPRPDLPEPQLDHLTELGLRQSQSAGRALAGRGVVSILSSPASRARETAEAAARAMGGVPVSVDARLQPLVLGRAADGRALDWDERIAEWKAGRDPSPPGGESMAAVGDRVAALVRELARSAPGTSVVLVAHSEVIGAYLGRVRAMPPAERYPPAIGNGSISVVDVSDPTATDGHATVMLTSYDPAVASFGMPTRRNPGRKQQP